MLPSAHREQRAQFSLKHAPAPGHFISTGLKAPPSSHTDNSGIVILVPEAASAVVFEHWPCLLVGISIQVEVMNVPCRRDLLAPYTETKEGSIEIMKT